MPLSMPSRQISLGRTTGTGALTTNDHPEANHDSDSDYMFADYDSDGDYKDAKDDANYGELPPPHPCAMCAFTVVKDS